MKTRLRPTDDGSTLALSGRPRVFMPGRTLTDDSALGVRVRRGPDWKWGDQDEHNGVQQAGTTCKDDVAFVASIMASLPCATRFVATGSCLRSRQPLIHHQML